MRFSEFYSKSEKAKYDKYVDDLAAACATKSKIILVTLGKVGEFDIYRITVNPDIRRTILIGATMHGDEPVGAYAVLEYLKVGKFPKNTRLIILPCMNPHGFMTDDRFMMAGGDMNRQWKTTKKSAETKLIQKTLSGESIDMFLSMHEDSGIKGFYCYLSDKKYKKCSEPIFQIADKYIKVNTQPTIRGDKAENGLIVVNKADLGEPHHAKSIEYWLQKTKATPYIVTETPSNIPLRQRITVGKQIIQYVVNNWFQTQNHT